MSIQAVPSLLKPPKAESGNRHQTLQKLPWDAKIARNQVYNRGFIEIFGYCIWQIILARNNYERFEKFSDSAAYLLLGTAAPIMLDKLINNKIRAYFRKTYAKAYLSGQKLLANPVDIPFECLDASRLKQGLHKFPELYQKIQARGLKILPLKMARQIMATKLGFMVFDLGAIFMVNIAVTWGRNWLTQKLSGQKGFSGIYNIASKDYRAREADKKEQSKDNRFWVTMASGILGVVTLPLLLRAGLHSQTPIGAKGFVGQIKRIIPIFNYADAIYISKFTLLWQTITGYNVSMILASRDKNELRENITKQLAMDFFYFIGDDIIAGILAKSLQQQYKRQLKGIQLWNKGPCGIPLALPYEQLFKTGNNAAQKLANKLSRKIFWTGLSGTAMCLGVALTLANNWYTKKRVLEEDSA